MIIAALALLCCNTLSADTPRIPEVAPVRELKSDAPAAAAVVAEDVRPNAPTPKTSVAVNGEPELGATGEASTPGNPMILSAPIRPASTEMFETPRKRKIWYGLMAVNHGAAAFDAWTTRRAITGGYGVEGDPFQRPFAHSGAIYASTQVTPLITDFLGHRMMRSRHEWIRRAWWMPQMASVGVSLGAGMHNYRVTH